MNLTEFRNILSSPAELASVRNKAKTIVDTFPKNGCAAFASVVLSRCGVNIEPCQMAEEVANRLKKLGWQKIGLDDPQPGDALITIDLNGNGFADHVAIVTAQVKPGVVKVLDNYCEWRHGDYERNLGPGKFTPAAYLLRFVG